jgi:drug/metabolite transporter (DMT)-like permease
VSTATPLTRGQAAALVALTLMWGVNWPMMKLSLTGMTPLMFRAHTMTVGALWLWLFYRWRGVRMWPQGREWGQVALLGLPNILAWHVCSIMGITHLASGRAAVLGFTMPIWTVLISALITRAMPSRRTWAATACVAVAVALLLSHEVGQIAGRPAGVAWMVAGAMSWALGTVLARRTVTSLPVEALTVWMMLLSAACLWLLAASLEPWPSWNFTAPVWWSLVYSVTLNFGFAQIIWFGLVRKLPPETSAMGIMAVPLIGTLSAAFIMGERPHWQDYVAIAFVMAAMAAVLYPPRAASGSPPRP